MARVEMSPHFKKKLESEWERAAAPRRAQVDRIRSDVQRELAGEPANSVEAVLLDRIRRAGLGQVNFGGIREEAERIAGLGRP